MKLSKKNILVTGLAVTLAAATIIGGGTFAYLQGTTDDVVNTFQTNKVMVELTETGDGQYSIIPGTSQDKDPTVTVDNTIGAYAYVVVTDKTDGLVDYEIDDGWELLTGYTNVYYREVAADADEKEFAVLKDNKVSYDAALENSDMLDGDNLREGVELTFTARAIQKEGFADAVSAYEGLPAMATTADELIAVMANAKDGDVIELKNDIVLDKPLTIDRDVTISGDDNTIVSRNPVYVAEDTKVTFDRITFTAPTSANNNATSVYAQSLNSKLVFEGCSFVDFQWEGIQITPVAGAEIVVNNCYFSNSKAMAETGIETKRYLHIEVTETTEISNIRVTVTNNTFENVVPSAKGGEGYFTDSVVTISGVPHANITCSGNLFTGKVQKDALSNSAVIWIDNGDPYNQLSYEGFTIAEDAELVD